MIYSKDDYFVETKGIGHVPDASEVAEGVLELQRKRHLLKIIKHASTKDENDEIGAVMKDEEVAEKLFEVFTGNTGYLCDLLAIW